MFVCFCLCRLTENDNFITTVHIQESGAVISYLAEVRLDIIDDKAEDTSR